MSDALFDGKKFRIFTLVDNYSRKSLILHSGISIKGENLAEILKLLPLSSKPIPSVLRLIMAQSLSAKHWTDGLMKEK